jgi:putative ubiquitin-RnfH superfamily antitoxin RatB of RatAB toxin-antitoxin module
MASADEIEVDVVYATPTRQFAKTLSLPAGSSVEQAIRASGLLEALPELDLARQRVGVFGELVQLDDCLQGGERVEIYRPLLADPKEARRQRAQAKKRR